MKTQSRFILVAVLAGAAASGAPPPKAVSEANNPALVEEPLTDLARAVLKRRMGRHGGDFAELSTAAVLLRYEAVTNAATRIANEPRLVRPVAGGEDDVNAGIPERFFVLQDDLRAKAQQLAVAGRQRNSAQLQSSFAQLSAACMNCHAAYKPDAQ